MQSIAGMINLRMYCKLFTTVKTIEGCKIAKAFGSVPSHMCNEYARYMPIHIICLTDCGKTAFCDFGPDLHFPYLFIPRDTDRKADEFFVALWRNFKINTVLYYSNWNKQNTFDHKIPGTKIKKVINYRPFKIAGPTRNPEIKLNVKYYKINLHYHMYHVIIYIMRIYGRDWVILRNKINGFVCSLTTHEERMSRLRLGFHSSDAQNSKSTKKRTS